APPFVADPGMSVATASAVMSTHKIGCLPIMNGERLIGIVTRTDMLTFLAHERVPRAWPELCVADVMQSSPVTVHANESLAYAAVKMLRNGVRHLPVVDVANHVLGMLSDRDLRSAIGDPELLTDAAQAPLRLDQRTVGDVMTRIPAVVRPSDPLTHVAERLSEEQLGALIVIDEQLRLLGIVSYVDVLQAMLATAGRSH
ncbi:MAG TPA: CBS domain-containing protein, partial [Polyangiales bacterium]